MEEQASFETRAVIVPRRGGWNRLLIVVPALVLVGVVWAGAVGRQSPLESAAATSAVAAVALPSPSAASRGNPIFPVDALGLQVRRLNEVDPNALRANQIVAIAGWYETTAITGCPKLTDLFRRQAGAEANVSIDSSSYCDRFGVLYARDPLDTRPMLYDVSGGSTNVGLDKVDATLVQGVVMPLSLQQVSGAAVAVVVLAHFTPAFVPAGTCVVPLVCPLHLVVDHVTWAWT